MIVVTKELREFVKKRMESQEGKKKELKEAFKKLLTELGERRIVAIYENKPHKKIDEIVALIISLSDYYSLGISSEMVTCPNCGGIYFPDRGGICPFCNSGPFFNKDLIHRIKEG